MKHFTAILFCALLLPFAASANQRAQGYCTQGGQVVVTSGINSTTKVMQSYPSCTVTVYLTGTLTLATIFSDNSSTPLSNPFSASTTGLWFWYAANGRYDVKLSGGGIPSPFTIGDILLADPAGGGTTVSSITAGNGISTNASTGAVTVTNTWGAVPTGTQSQQLQIQTNTGNNTTYQFAAKLFSSSSDYAYSSITPTSPSTLTGGGGAQTITVAVCPLGLVSSGTWSPVQLTAGSGGVSEVSTPSGGTCSAATLGIGGGTIIVSPAQNHGAGYQLNPASGGLQEAICNLPSAGGVVIVPSSITLLANVTACGKTSVVVTKLSGATVSGSFTILGSTTDNAGTYQSISTQGSWTGAENFKAFGSTIGDVPEAFNTQTSVFGGVHVPANSIGGQAAGVHGVVVTEGSVSSMASIASLADAYMNGSNVFSSWAFAGGVQNCYFAPFGSGCGAGLGYQAPSSSVSMYGAELDVSAWKTGSTAYNGGVTGLQITGNTEAQVGGTSTAINIDKLGITNSIPWKIGINTTDGSVGGSTPIGLYLGAISTANNSASQQIVLRSINSGGTAHANFLFADASGNWIMFPGSGQQTILQDGSQNTALSIVPNGSTPWVSVNNQVKATMLIGVGNYISSETGANNAIVGTFTLAPTVADGFCVVVKLAHTLQAGANTFNYNSGGAVAIKSHFNPASNIATGYAVGARWSGCYDAANSVWQDSSQ